MPELTAGESQVPQYQLAARQFISSGNLGKLSEALAKAQGEIEGAKKDSANPFFHSKYADLASVWDACRGPLSKHGLAVIQLPGRNGEGLFVDSILSHSSGEWISSRLFINPGYTNKEGTFQPLEDPQALGSAITYARRYGLQALVGIAPEDDDGNAATGRQQTREDAAKTARNAPAGATKESKGKKKEVAGPSIDGDEVPMFNGPNHKNLAGRLSFYEILPDDFMSAMRAEKRIPNNKMLFGQMPDEMAKWFTDNIEEMLSLTKKYCETKPKKSGN